MTTFDFNSRFKELTGHTPFEWQRRLFEGHFMQGEIEKGKAGDLFSDFLKEQGTYEATTEQAIKRVIAFQLASVMEEKGITKVEMAKQLETSRSQLDGLLDPENDKVTLATLSRAAKVVGRELTLELR